MKKKLIVGYTTGVFDLFHIGHLNILKNSKSLCDYLIVGVTTDEISLIMKGKMPIIPFEERFQIVESIRYVDKVVAKTSVNNIEAWNDLKFDVMIKGDDWKGTQKGFELENTMGKVGVIVKYLPYTTETSSSVIRLALSNFQ